MNRKIEYSIVWSNFRTIRRGTYIHHGATSSLYQGICIIRSICNLSFFSHSHTHTQEILFVWKSTEILFLHSEEDVAKNICQIVKNIHKCLMIMEAVVSRKRRKVMIEYVKFKGPLALRTYLFHRISYKLPTNHPAKHEIVDKRPRMYTDNVCKKILQMGLLFPNTSDWMKSRPERMTISSKICDWIIYEMTEKPRDKIIVPETLALSLPYLDRICVICSIFTSILSKLLSDAHILNPKHHSCESRRKGIDGICWDLATDGITKEIYEWDSTFVQRLLRLPTRDENLNPPLDLVAKRYMFDALHNCMLDIPMSTNLPFTSDGKNQHHHISVLERERFKNAFQSHLVGLHNWFMDHMKVHGIIYDHYF